MKGYIRAGKKSGRKFTLLYCDTPEKRPYLPDFTGIRFMEDPSWFSNKMRTAENKEVDECLRKNAMNKRQKNCFFL